MVPLFTSCPTFFLLSQLPPPFRGTFYPRCITIWPLYDLVRHDTRVWPQAGRISVSFVQSEPSDVAWWWDWSHVIGEWPKKVADITGESLNRCPTFHNSSYFLEQKALLALLLRSLSAHLVLFLQTAFVSWQVWVACTVYRSSAVQGGEAESVMSWHSVIQKNTSMAFEPTQLHSSQECSHIIQHPPTASPLSACHLTLDCLTLALLRSSVRSRVKTRHLMQDANNYSV